MIIEMVGHKQLHAVNTWRCRMCIMLDKKFDLEELKTHLEKDHGVGDLIIESKDGEIWRKITH